MLAVTCRERLNTASSGSQINGIETVKAGCPFEITRPKKIRLLNTIDACPFQAWIFFTLGLVATCSAVCEFMTIQNTIDGSQRWQRAYSQVVQFPTNGLCSTKYPFVVKIETHHLHRLLNFIGCVRGMGLRTPRFLLRPVGVVRTISCNPLVQPAARAFKRQANIIGFFAREKTLNS